MNKLEEYLCEVFNKKYCCFTGSGTAAIYLILKALNMQNKKVLFPNIACTSPVNAAVYAGYEVVFCDVNLENYTIDIDSLRYMIEKYDVGIVVPIHIYGHKCDILPIKQLLEDNNIFIIEDSAQTIEISNLDASIISFGHTKIFESEDGGGAILTNNKELMEKINLEKKLLPLKPDNINKLFDVYRNEYYSIVRENSNEKYIKLYNLQLKNKNTFLFHLENNENIIKTINRYKDKVDLRLKKAQIYSKNLKNISKAKYMNEKTLWRYSFLYYGDRDMLIEEARKNNIDISSWYIMLNKIYGINDDQFLKNSEIVERSIVNLWIDEIHDEEKILRDVKILRYIMEEDELYEYKYD